MQPTQQKLCSTKVIVYRDAPKINTYTCGELIRYTIGCPAKLPYSTAILPSQPEDLQNTSHKGQTGKRKYTVIHQLSIFIYIYPHATRVSCIITTKRISSHIKLSKTELESIYTTKSISLWMLSQNRSLSPLCSHFQDDDRASDPDIHLKRWWSDDDLAAAKLPVADD